MLALEVVSTPAVRVCIKTVQLSPTEWGLPFSTRFRCVAVKKVEVRHGSEVKHLCGPGERNGEKEEDRERR